jgi:flagellar hook-associated protein 2
MAISAPGIGSNLDINSIVSQLMTVEQRPLTLLGAKEARFQSRLSAVGQVKGVLSTLQLSLSALKDASRFAGFRATTSDSTVATATTSSFADAGSYGIDVTQLASAQKLFSKSFAAADATVGSGTLTIQFGTTTGSSFSPNAERPALTIAVDAANDSLAGIRDAINAKKAGVTASIINDGSGFRLSISSTETGAASSLRITAADADGNHTDDAGLSQLVFDPAGVRRLTESQAARNAVFSVDGITVSQSGNVVNGVISGVTLTLRKEGTTTLGVSRDDSATRSAIEAFVKAYNDANKTLADLAAYNPETRQAGALQGDSTVRTIRTQMRSLLGGTLPFASGGLRNLSEAGLSFALDGSLNLDAAKLQAVLDDPAKDLASLFAAVGRPSDGNVRFASAGASLKAGEYALSVSQLASRAVISAGTLLNGNIIAGVNDTLDLAVDGTAVSVTLTAGSYAASAFAAELQSKVNGALGSGGAAVTVAATGTGGSLAGSVAAPLMIDASNDTIDVTLNGVTRNVTLSRDTYLSAAALAAEIQSKTNAAFATDGFAVSVTEAAGVLTISAANSFGTGSTVAVNGLGADALLGVGRIATAGSAGTLSITSNRFGAASTLAGFAIDPSLVAPASIDTTNATGVDVAGSLGGVAASGSGQLLSGAGSATGLSVLVTGGTTGDRGAIAFDRGFAAQLDAFLTGVLGSGGLLASRTEGIESAIAAIGKDRELIGRRLVLIEARLRRQFTALDTLIAGMTQTSNFLQQQLATLPGARRSDS